MRTLLLLPWQAFDHRRLFLGVPCLCRPFHIGCAPAPFFVGSWAEPEWPDFDLACRRAERRASDDDYVVIFFEAYSICARSLS